MLQFPNIPNIDPSWTPWILLTLVWVLPWKGVALWKAARKKSAPWFVALLVINTMGVLEILYVFIFSEWKKFLKKPRSNARLKK